jgi:membrane protein implicated in regulation of membrane protease activity
MDGVVGFLEGLTLWHWIGVGIVLLTIEVAVGTFDLLWIGLAAFATALFALVVPDPLGGWQGQLTWFAIVAVGFVAMGRTVFRGLRRAPSSHPNLNNRQATLIGARGEAITSFDNNRGRVKIGDSVWAASQTDDAVIVEGDQVVVSAVDGTTLKVRLI